MRLTSARPAATKIEKVLFVQLIVTAILAVLAFGTVEPWSLAIFEINALVMAVFGGLLPLVDRKFEWRHLLPSLPLWLLLGWALLQVVPLGSGAGPAGLPESLPLEQLRLRTISFDPQATREAAAKLMALAIYFSVALIVLRDSARQRLAVRIFSVFGLAVSLLAIVQRLAWNGKLYWIRPVSAFVAPFGPYGNYNHFAGMVELLFPLPFAWLIFSRCRLDERIFHGVAVAIMVAAAVLSMSRAGILSIGLQLLVFGAAMIPARRRAVLPLLIVPAAILLSLWVGYQPLQRRFSSIQSGTSEHSVVTRLAYWKASWQIFTDHPLTGVGLGAFPTVYPSYGSASSRYERLEQVHNDYLQLLTDLGLTGGVVMAIGLLAFIRRWYQTLSRGVIRRGEDLAIFLGALVAVIGILLHSIFDFNLQIPANALLALLMGAISVSSRLIAE